MRYYVGFSQIGSHFVDLSMCSNDNFDNDSGHRANVDTLDDDDDDNSSNDEVCLSRCVLKFYQIH